jgi:hypothetical protein
MSKITKIKAPRKRIVIKELVYYRVKRAMGHMEFLLDEKTRRQYYHPAIYLRLLHKFQKRDFMIGAIYKDQVEDNICKTILERT